MVAKHRVAVVNEAQPLWPLVVLATTVASPSKAGGAFLVFLAEPVEEEELLQCAEAQKAFFPCSHIID